MDILHDESVCCCALNRIFGFKPRIALALISSLGSASEVFRLEGTELDSILGKQSSARQAINLRTLEKTARELEQLQSMGCTFIHIGSPHYPALLKECDDPPVWLYMKSASSPEERVIVTDAPSERASGAGLIISVSLLHEANSAAVRAAIAKIRFFMVVRFER